MKICHMENITNLSRWKKNSRLFRFSFGDRNLGTKHTQETHTMNLSGDIGRKSGFSYESKRYFDEAKYPWRFCAGKIWRETKGKSRGPFYVGPNQRNVCESAEENVSWKYLRSKLLCVFLYVRGEKEGIGSGLLRANLAQNHKKLPWIFFIQNCFLSQKVGGDLFITEENFCFTEG